MSLDNDIKEIMLVEMEATSVEHEHDFTYSQNVPLDGDISLTRSDLLSASVEYIIKNKKKGKRKRVSKR